MKDKTKKQNTEDIIEIFRKIHEEKIAKEKEQKGYNSKIDDSEIEHKGKRRLKAGKIKNKTGFFRKAGEFAYKLFLVATFGSAAAFWGNVGVQFGINKAQSNKVDKALEYYGGTDKYLRNGLFGPYVKFKTKDTKHIKVGYDESVNDETAKQFDYCFDYLNGMFSVINPNYHFETIRTNSEQDCNIFVRVCNLKENFPDSDDFTMATTYNRSTSNKYFDYYNYCHANIDFSENFIDKPARLRYAMMHELEHVLLVNTDLTYNKDDQFSHHNVPYSTLSYEHVGDMYVSLMYYKVLGNPVLNEEYNQKFVTYAPFDVAVYAARYGDIDNIENRNACTKLIVDTYNTCKTVFGDQKYFLESEELNEDGYPVKFEFSDNQNTKYIFTIPEGKTNKDEDEMILNQ